MRQTTIGFKRKSPSLDDNDNGDGGEPIRENVCNNVRKESPITIDINDLPWDPSDRPRILDYSANQRKEIRRTYWVRGPCQPRGHNFPSKTVGGKGRRFVVKWFDEFNWLEYSVKVDKAFCLCCYLFRDYVGHQGGSDTFVTTGFNCWSKKSAFKAHLGNVDSFHNKALQKCEYLMQQNQSIAVAFHKHTNAEKIKYRVRLSTTIESIKFLLRNALPFRGHDESENSLSIGLFFGILSLLRDHNETIREATLENAPKNNQLTSPKIQKEIIDCFAKEIIVSICEEIGDDVFALLVDESSDISKKEQMAVILRFVDKCGVVKERFIGVVHVNDICALTLKLAIDSLFTEYRLTWNKVRGQGYDGASNMRGELNGLKALILKDNDSAYYIHCFAHQLQLVVVAIAKKHDGVVNFFDMLATVTNVVCASCKRKDIMRETQRERIQKEVNMGETETGRGLNQELSLTRAGDTRWGSHHKTIMGLIKLFPEVVTVLKYVEEEGATTSNQTQASGILSYFKTLDFVFYLHLLLHILGLTDVLSQHLQQKDQDILQAASFVKGTKQALQEFRKTGFTSFLKKVCSFCQKYDLLMVEMTDMYVAPRNRRTKITNQYHFEVEIFNTVLDMKIQEFGDRFSEVNTELLENMMALSPCDSFSNFDASKLVKLSEMYPNDFSADDRLSLMSQVEVCYQIMSNSDKFANLNNIANLARLMVETKLHLSFHLVYRLLKLALVLPVATATVERCFSKMKLVKIHLRNRMGDNYLNNALVCSIEKEALDNVTTEVIIDRFQRLGERRGQL